MCGKCAKDTVSLVIPARKRLGNILHARMVQVLTCELR